MFVKLWWISLWACFQPAAVDALSHSQVVEWIFGSRIQSHWPCITLCPISMFSRILATLRPTVPSTHAGGRALKSRVARLASSRRRCTVTTLRMYAESFSPRTSRMSWRIVSSSIPICSMSSGVRWAVGFSGFLVIAVMGMPLLVSWRAGLGGQLVGSVVDVARVGGGADAGLDEDAVARGGGGELAVAQVAHRALAQRQHTPEADAHPAAAGHQ